MKANTVKTNTKLIVNSTPQEVRVAILENDRLAELYIERENERGIVGNIYKGKVVRVLPGMQASFVDIGLERAAFLYVTDFFDEYGDAFNQREVEEEKRRTRNNNNARIEDLVREGQEVLVQVAKDPIGTKGARLTSHISLPGRYLVYMPTVNHVGVSRKIETEAERRRLKDLVRDTKTLEGGFIIRTAASKQPDQNIIHDILYLEKLWKKIQSRKVGMKAPSLIHEDLPLVQRVVRDFLTEDVQEFIVDDKDAYRRIKQFITLQSPEDKDKILLYKDKKPIFDNYKIEERIDQAISRKVWLKSGGYLIIDQTEALTSIDVNTGRFVGSKNLEETILKTNLEAVDEIVAQLRLRNLGGLIILDTIDMSRRSNREKVYRRLERVLADDKAKTNVLQISELGLVEMTRKRTRESMVRVLCEPCAHCDGKGFHKSSKTIAYSILRKLGFEIEKRKTHENIEIVAHPLVANILKNSEYEFLVKLEQQTGRSIIIREQPNFNTEHFQINFTGQDIVTAYTSPTKSSALTIDEEDDTPDDYLLDSSPHVEFMKEEE